MGIRTIIPAVAAEKWRHLAMTTTRLETPSHALTLNARRTNGQRGSQTSRCRRAAGTASLRGAHVLGLWCRSLVPIVDQFVRAASGKVDVAFWRRIYMPVDAYGGDVITGWITRLYPYIEVEGKVDTPNPMLELAIDEPKHRTSKKQRMYNGPGIRSDAVPMSVSRATVRIIDPMSREIKAVALVAGVTAVVQADDGALRPIAGWHLENARAQMGDVIERILAEHQVVRPSSGEPRRFLSGSAEVMELYSQIETATLFKGPRAWHLRSPREHQRVHLTRAAEWSLDRIADLPSGMSLCSAMGDYAGTVYWVVSARSAQGCGIGRYPRHA